MTTRQRARVALFKLFIPGLVQPKQSTRVAVRGGKARGYQPAKVKNYEAYVRGLATEAWQGSGITWMALDQPLELIATIYLPRPKSRPAKRFPFPDRKPDIGNCMKPIEDAIEAGRPEYWQGA